jgi:cellobiose phosphorylase
MEQITIIYTHARGAFVALATVRDGHDPRRGAERQVFAAFAHDYNACAEEAKQVLDRPAAQQQHGA